MHLAHIGTTLLHWLSIPFKSRRWTAAITLFLCISLWGCSNSVQAGGPVDAKFKDQVLQVIRENPQVILDSVRDYQKKQQQTREQGQQSFLQSLKTNPTSIIGQSPVRGAKNGKTLLVEFSDFQCPYCAKAHDTLKQMLARFPDRVTLVYKHFPLTSIHPQALPAAKAAWAAGQQGKFWEYHDALFDKQDQLGEDLFKQTAQALKLDAAKFDRDRNSNEATKAVEQDTKLGEEIGVDGTPFFVVSGEKFSGPVQLPDLEALLAQSNG